MSSASEISSLGNPRFRTIPLSNKQILTGGVHGTAPGAQPRTKHRNYRRRAGTKKSKSKGKETTHVGSDDPGLLVASLDADTILGAKAAQATSSSDLTPTIPESSSPSIRHARPLSVAVGGHCRGPGGGWYKRVWIGLDGYWVNNSGLILDADTITPGVPISGYAQRSDGFYEPDGSGNRYTSKSSLSIVSVPYDMPTRGIFNEAVKSLYDDAYRVGLVPTRHDVTVARSGFFGVLRHDYISLKEIDEYLLSRGSLSLDSIDVIRSLTQVAVRHFASVPSEIVLDSILVHCFHNATVRTPTMNLPCQWNLLQRLGREMELQRLGPTRGPPPRNLIMGRESAMLGILRESEGTVTLGTDITVTDAGPEGLDISQLPSAYTTAYNEQLEYPGELKVFIEVNCKELVHGGGTGGQAKYVAQCHMLKRTSDLTYIMNMPSLSQAETLQHPCRVEQMPKNHIFFNKEPEFDIPITNTDDGIDDLYFLNACKEKQDSLSKSKAEKFRKSYVKDKMNADGGVVMTAHARQRMRERHITEEDIVMKNVTVIYAQSKGPKIIVQTVYRKDKEDWKRDLIKKDRIKVERC